MAHLPNIAKNTFAAARGNGTPEIVIGYPVTIEGLEEYEFFVYQCQEGRTLQWYICEKSTGLAMNRRWNHRNTRKGAVADAKECIQSVGIERTKEYIAKAKKIGE